MKCRHDSNQDGDCHLCQRVGGCPVGLFKRIAIDAATMSPEQIAEFKQDARLFEYNEPMGQVRGYRHRDGRILVTSIFAT